MEIKYKFLDKSYIEQIHDCFIESFKDYNVDMSYMTLERMISRGRMDRVDYSLSVGAFNNNHMIGFILIGIDKIDNKLTAFDAGTGVVEGYRGNGIAGKMFEFALARLKNIGVKKFSLEVIQDNKSAINAYQKAGFSIKRSFNCYKLNTSYNLNKFDPEHHIEIKSLTREELGNYLDILDWEISWEYNYSAISNIKEDIIIYGAFTEGRCVGFIVFYPVLNWIFMLAVQSGYHDANIDSVLLTTLLKRISPDVVEIKFNNIPPEHSMNEFLKKSGFEVYITQYEMEFNI